MRAVRDILLEIDRFVPEPGDDADWSPLTALVRELAAHPGGKHVASIDPLLRVLDRFKHRHGFATWWPLVNSIEAIPRYELALIASYQLAPTPSGLALLLRVLGRGVHVIDDVDLAAFAASVIEEDA